MKKKLVLMTSAFMAISLLAGCGHQHSFKEVDEVAATCTESGVHAHYTCEGCDKLFDEDKKETTLEALTITALGHDYQFDSFVWADDYSAQAKYVCSHDNKHVEMHNALIDVKQTTAPTCENTGLLTYTSTYETHSDTKTVVLEAKGHSWGNPTYVWNDDHTECVATSVCSNDASHVLNENGIIEVTPIVPVTCEASGTAKFTATFTNEEFVTQEVEGTVEALGHDYQFVEFVWEGFFAAKAKYVCSHDDSHVELHDAQVVDSLVTPATCEEEGLRTWTATYGDHSETKEQTIEALGHNLTAHDAHAETCTEAGNSAYWSCDRCNKFFSDAEGKTEIENNSWVIPAHHTLTHHEAIGATRLEDGNIEYWTCDVCEKYFSDGEGKNEIDAQSITIPALGTDKSYFKNKTYSGSDRYLYFGVKEFDDYKANCIYSFTNFDYNDETKVLSFIITKIQVIKGESPYEVGDTISFTYDAEKDVLMFGAIALSKANY